MRLVPLLSCLVPMLVVACEPAQLADFGDDGDESTGDGGVTDADGDGVPASADCDDHAPTVHPGAPERCDGVDNDCDGRVDDADGDVVDALTWYRDGDGDGHGDGATPTSACEAPSGSVASGDDCDDGNAAISPTSREVCNEIDDDCDGGVDEGVEPTWYLDYDGDGFGDSSLKVVACEPPSHRFVTTGGDCDDADADAFPRAPEGCDDVDRDCDGSVDQDADGDGYSDASCGGSDCDDGDVTIKPDSGGSCALGASCQDILDLDRSSGDGVYGIDPDGYGVGLDPVDVYCDMTTDGGGWTLAQRTVWEWRESRVLVTDYAGWYGETFGNPAAGYAFRVAGEYWTALDAAQEHMVVHEMRDAADDGTSCDPLYYIGTEGTLTIDDSGAMLTGLIADVPLISNARLATTDVGYFKVCVNDYGGVPWFYNNCCANCPTFDGSYWSDEAHPMNSYCQSSQDLFGNVSADVCPSGSARRSDNGSSYFGGNATEYYLR